MEYLLQYFYSAIFYSAVTVGVLFLLFTCRNPLSALTTHFDPGKKAVQERIEGILDTSGKHQGWWIVALVLLLCLFSGSIFSCQKQTDAPAETTEDTLVQETAEEKTTALWTDPIPAEKSRWHAVPDMPENVPEEEENAGHPVWSIGLLTDPDCPIQIDGFLYQSVYGIYGNAKESWLRLQLQEDGRASEVYLYVPLGCETAPIALIRETETMYSLYLSVFCGRDYFFRYTLTAEEDGYTVSAPLETEYLTLVEVGAVDTKLHTASTLEEIRQYTDQGVWGEQVYDFLWNLLSGKSEIPEYNTVKITDSRLTFAIPLEPEYCIWWDFTVTESGLETLPPGTYHKEIRDIVDCYLSDPLPLLSQTGEGEREHSESQMIVSFIGYSLMWNTPTYGEGTEYPGMQNYLCEYYGNGKIPLEDYIRLAKEKFGADLQEEEILMVEEEDGIKMVYAGGLGGNPRYHVTETEREETMSHVTVQFYADCNGLLPAGKVVYHITKDGVFFGYDIVEPFRYEPYDLRYWPDAAA